MLANMIVGIVQSMEIGGKPNTKNIPFNEVNTLLEECKMDKKYMEELVELLNKKEELSSYEDNLITIRRRVALIDSYNLFKEQVRLAEEHLVPLKN